MLKGILQNSQVQNEKAQEPTIANPRNAKLDHRNPKILAAARLYEQQFLGQMVTAMRKAVPKSDYEKETMGEKIYKDQLFDQYVETWTNVGGIGLSDIIYNQIVQRYAPSEATNQSQKVQKPHGPIPTDQNKTFKIESQAQPNNHSSMILKISPQKNSTDSKILSPWAGELIAVQSLDSGEKVAFIKHDNGMQSTFLFKGKLVANKKDFGPGEPIALLDGEMKDYTWKLNRQG